MKTPRDIAELLEVEYQSFNYWIYRTPVSKRYKTFWIQKKSGGRRRIDAPTTNIKILQQKLNQVLQSVYSPKPSAYGFVLERNIRMGAERHVGKRWVFNVDLENFFPSINFGRVRGMFMGKPYNLPVRVATVLAHLCCYRRRLPQGAPTSPVISNMICAQMDSQLQKLAGEHQCTYTRYADDITFSTTRRYFPYAIGELDTSQGVRLGTALTNVIENNGFTINRRKVWLYGRERRQEVTGVTVNDFPNVNKKLISQIRAMIHAWEVYGLCAAQEHFESKYDTKHRAPFRKPPRFEKVIKGKIEFLGMIKGQDSLRYLKFLDQLRDLDPELAGPRGTPLRLLLERYINLETSDANPQSRGYEFEDVLKILFEIFEIPVMGSFMRNERAEQIDFAFKLNEQDYLGECKWRKTKSSPSDLDAFHGKVDRSGEQTMGLFVSVSGWSGNVVNTLKRNRRKTIILVDGDDLTSVLSGHIGLNEMLNAKADALSLYSEPYLSAAKIIDQ